MQDLKDIIIDGSKTLGILLLVFGIAAILAIPILIGLIIDCIPLVLFGALFFTAFAGAIFKKGLEKTGQLDK